MGRDNLWLLMVEEELGVELAVASVVSGSFQQQPSVPRTGCHQGLYHSPLLGWLRGLPWSPGCGAGHQRPSGWGQSCCRLVFPTCPQRGARAGMPLPPKLRRLLEEALSGGSYELRRRSRKLAKEPCESFPAVPAPAQDPRCFWGRRQLSCESLTRSTADACKGKRS